MVLRPESITWPRGCSTNLHCLGRISHNQLSFRTPNTNNSRRRHGLFIVRPVLWKPALPPLRALPPVVLPPRTMFEGFFLLLKNVTWSLHSTAILKQGRDTQLSNLENNHPFLSRLDEANWNTVTRPAIQLQGAGLEVEPSFPAVPALLRSLHIHRPRGLYQEPVKVPGTPSIKNSLDVCTAVVDHRLWRV